ncbi:IS30 family transposase [Oceanospirillum sanctuarii]|uniref:IS30 family transposase n=1 Tax=Oceanospirillum sanctuarii TaxID=1434821 RepID=UPI000A376994|nr:IS30 family transposase [Oceanospirillum sanctuarii]
MSYIHLTENERYQIYSLKKAGLNQKEIAEHIGRSFSTLSRELGRNKGFRGYRPKQAHKLAEERKKKAYKATKVTPRILICIEVLIRQELSPQQVADYLAKYAGVELHHETIYQIIYQDKAQGGDLYQHLRVVLKPYRKRYGRYDHRGKIKNRVCIEKRPLIVDERSRIGDWEGDTVIGGGRKGALLTLVERKALYTIIVRLNSKHAGDLAQAAVDAMTPLKDKVHTITFDNGMEFSGHETIAKELNAEIYFAHPYSSWERGINENTNGLIREHFPKGTDFNQVTDDDVQRVMDRLNNSPRKTRGCQSPNELFMAQRVDLLAA